MIRELVIFTTGSDNALIRIKRKDQPVRSRPGNQ